MKRVIKKYFYYRLELNKKIEIIQGVIKTSIDKGIAFIINMQDVMLGRILEGRDVMLGRILEGRDVMLDEIKEVKAEMKKPKYVEKVVWIMMLIWVSIILKTEWFYEEFFLVEINKTYKPVTYMDINYIIKLSSDLEDIIKRYEYFTTKIDWKRLQYFYENPNSLKVFLAKCKENSKLIARYWEESYIVDNYEILSNIANSEISLTKKYEIWSNDTKVNSLNKFSDLKNLTDQIYYTNRLQNQPKIIYEEFVNKFEQFSIFIIKLYNEILFNIKIYWGWFYWSNTLIDKTLINTDVFTNYDINLNIDLMLEIVKSNYKIISFISQEFELNFFKLERLIFITENYNKLLDNIIDLNYKVLSFYKSLNLINLSRNQCYYGTYYDILNYKIPKIKKLPFKVDFDSSKIEIKDSYKTYNPWLNMFTIFIESYKNKFKYPNIKEYAKYDDYFSIRYMDNLDREDINKRWESLLPYPKMRIFKGYKKWIRAHGAIDTPEFLDEFETEKIIRTKLWNGGYTYWWTTYQDLVRPDGELTTIEQKTNMFWGAWASMWVRGRQLEYKDLKYESLNSVNDLVVIRTKGKYFFSWNLLYERAYRFNVWMDFVISNFNEEIMTKPPRKSFIFGRRSNILFFRDILKEKQLWYVDKLKTENFDAKLIKRFKVGYSLNKLLETKLQRLLYRKNLYLNDFWLHHIYGKLFNENQFILVPHKREYKFFAVQEKFINKKHLIRGRKALTYIGEIKNDLAKKYKTQMEGVYTPQYERLLQSVGNQLAKKLKDLGTTTELDVRGFDYNYPITRHKTTTKEFHFWGIKLMSWIIEPRKELWTVRYTYFPKYIGIRFWHVEPINDRPKDLAHLVSMKQASLLKTVNLFLTDNTSLHYALNKSWNKYRTDIQAKKALIDLKQMLRVMLSKKNYVSHARYTEKRNFDTLKGLLIRKYLIHFWVNNNNMKYLNYMANNKLNWINHYSLLETSNNNGNNVEVNIINKTYYHKVFVEDKNYLTKKVDILTKRRWIRAGNFKILIDMIINPFRHYKHNIVVERYLSKNSNIIVKKSYLENLNKISKMEEVWLEKYFIYKWFKGCILNFKLIINAKLFYILNQIYYYNINIITNIYKGLTYIKDFLMEYIFGNISDSKIWKKIKQNLLVKIIKGHIYINIVMFIFLFYIILCIFLLILIKTNIPKNLIYGVKTNEKLFFINLYKKLKEKKLINNNEFEYDYTYEWFYKKIEKKTTKKKKNLNIQKKFKIFYKYFVYEKNLWNKGEIKTKIRKDIEAWRELWKIRDWYYDIKEFWSEMKLILKVLPKEKDKYKISKFFPFKNKYTKLYQKIRVTFGTIIGLLKTLRIEYKDKKYNYNIKIIWNDITLDKYSKVTKYVFMVPTPFKNIFFAWRFILKLIRIWDPTQVYLRWKWLWRKGLAVSAIDYRVLEQKSKKPYLLDWYRDSTDYKASAFYLDYYELKNKIQDLYWVSINNIKKEDILITRNLVKDFIELGNNINKIKKINNFSGFLKNINHVAKKKKTKINEEEIWLNITLKKELPYTKKEWLEQGVMREFCHVAAQLKWEQEVKEINAGRKTKIQRVARTHKDIEKTLVLFADDSADSIINLKEKKRAIIQYEMDLRIANYQKGIINKILDLKDRPLLEESKKYREALEKEYLWLENLEKKTKNTKTEEEQAHDFLYKDVDVSYPFYRYFTTIGARYHYLFNLISNFIGLWLDNFKRVKQQDNDVLSFINSVKFDIKEIIYLRFWEYLFIFDKYKAFKKLGYRLFDILIFAAIIFIPISIILIITIITLIIMITIILFKKIILYSLHNISVIFYKLYNAKLGIKLITFKDWTKKIKKKIFQILIFFDKHIYYLKGAYKLGLKQGNILNAIKNILKYIYLNVSEKKYIKKNKLKIFWKNILFFYNMIKSGFIFNKLKIFWWKRFMNKNVETSNIIYLINSLLNWTFLFEKFPFYKLLKILIQNTLKIVISPITILIQKQQWRYIKNYKIKSDYRKTRKNSKLTNILLNRKLSKFLEKHKTKNTIILNFINSKIKEKKFPPKNKRQIIFWKKLYFDYDRYREQIYKFWLKKIINMEDLYIKFYNQTKLQDFSIIQKIKYISYLFKMEKYRSDIFYNLEKRVSRDLFFYNKAFNRKKIITRYLIKGTINWISYLWSSKAIFKHIEEIKPQKLKSKKKKYKYMVYNLKNLSERYHLGKFIEEMPAHLWVLVLVKEMAIKLVMRYTFDPRKEILYNKSLLNTRAFKWHIKRLDNGIHMDFVTAAYLGEIIYVYNADRMFSNMAYQFISPNLKWLIFGLEYGLTYEALRKNKKKKKNENNNKYFNEGNEANNGENSDGDFDDDFYKDFDENVWVDLSLAHMLTFNKKEDSYFYEIKEFTEQIRGGWFWRWRGFEKKHENNRLKYYELRYNRLIEMLKHKYMSQKISLIDLKKRRKSSANILQQGLKDFKINIIPMTEEDRVKELSRNYFYAKKKKFFYENQREDYVEWQAEEPHNSWTWEQKYYHQADLYNMKEYYSGYVATYKQNLAKDDIKYDHKTGDFAWDPVMYDTKHFDNNLARNIPFVDQELKGLDYFESNICLIIFDETLEEIKKFYRYEFLLKLQKEEGLLYDYSVINYTHMEVIPASALSRINWNEYKENVRSNRYYSNLTNRHGINVKDEETYILNFSELKFEQTKYETDKGFNDNNRLNNYYVAGFHLSYQEKLKLNHDAANFVEKEIRFHGSEDLISWLRIIEERRLKLKNYRTNALNNFKAFGINSKEYSIAYINNVRFSLEQWLGITDDYEEVELFEKKLIVLNEKHRLWKLKRIPLRTKLPVKLKVDWSSFYDFLKYTTDTADYKELNWFYNNKLSLKEQRAEIAWQLWKETMAEKYNITQHDLLLIVLRNRRNDPILKDIKKKHPNIHEELISKFASVHRGDIPANISVSWDLVRYIYIFTYDDEVDIYHYLEIKNDEFARADVNIARFIDKTDYVSFTQYKPLAYYYIYKSRYKNYLYPIFSMLSIFFWFWFLKIIFYNPGEYIFNMYLIVWPLVFAILFWYLKRHVKTQFDLKRGMDIYLYRLRSGKIINNNFDIDFEFYKSLAEQQMSEEIKDNKEKSKNIEKGDVEYGAMHDIYNNNPFISDKVKKNWWKFSNAPNFEMRYYYYEKNILKIFLLVLLLFSEWWASEEFRYRGSNWFWFMYLEKSLSKEQRNNFIPNTVVGDKSWKTALWHEDAINKWRLKTGSNPYSKWYVNMYKSFKSNHKISNDFKYITKKPIKLQQLDYGKITQKYNEINKRFEDKESRIGIRMDLGYEEILFLKFWKQLEYPLPARSLFLMKKYLEQPRLERKRRNFMENLVYQEKLRVHKIKNVYKMLRLPLKTEDLIIPTKMELWSNALKKEMLINKYLKPDKIIIPFLDDYIYYLKKKFLSQFKLDWMNFIRRIAFYVFYEDKQLILVKVWHFLDFNPYEAYYKFKKKLFKTYNISAIEHRNGTMYVRNKFFWNMYNNRLDTKKLIKHDLKIYYSLNDRSYLKDFNYNYYLKNFYELQDELKYLNKVNVIINNKFLNNSIITVYTEKEAQLYLIYYKFITYKYYRVGSRFWCYHQRLQPFKYSMYRARRDNDIILLMNYKSPIFLNNYWRPHETWRTNIELVWGSLANYKRLLVNIYKQQEDTYSKQTILEYKLYFLNYLLKHNEANLYFLYNYLKYLIIKENIDNKITIINFETLVKILKEINIVDLIEVIKRVLGL